MDKFIKKILEKSIVKDIEIGCSGNKVSEITNKNNEVFFIKESKENNLDKEYYIYNYLKDTGLVPKVIYFLYDKNKSIMLTEKLKGKMICDDDIFDDMKYVVNLAAKALKILQSLDISTCLIYNTLDIKLAIAKYNIENNLITTMEEKNTKKFGTPQKAYEYLINHKPKTEKLCFSHGDLSLPNIFFENDKITGFIDMGDAGVSDYWYDIAILVKSLRRNYETPEAEKMLFERLEIKPNYEVIEYYILLTELFL